MDDAFIQGLTSRGVVLRDGVTIRSGARGNGLHATVAIKRLAAGDVVASVPLGLKTLLNRSTVRAVAEGGCVALRDCIERVSPKAAPSMVVIVALLFFRFGPATTKDGDDDEVAFWRRYAAMLPQEIRTPLLMDPESTGMRLLAGTRLREPMEGKLARLRVEYAELKDAGAFDFGEITFEEFVWADRCFWTRSMSFGSVPEEVKASLPASAFEDDDHMVPLIDMANHALRPELRWELSADPVPCIQLRSIRDQSIDAGQELHISYGDKSNATLLMLHNFTIKSNPHDSVVFVPLFAEEQMLIGGVDGAVPSSVEFKRFLLKRVGIQHPLVVLRRRQGQDDEGEEESDADNDNYSPMGALLVATVSLISPDDDILPLLEEISTREALVSVLKSHALSDVLSLRVFSVMQGLIEERLMEMDGVDEDASALELDATGGDDGDDGAFVRDVLEVRRGMREIMQEGLERFHGLVEEYYQRESVQEYLSRMQCGV